MTDNETTKTEEFEIPAEALKSLTDSVLDEVKGALAKHDTDITAKLAKLDNVTDKGVGGAEKPADTEVGKTFGTTRATEGFEGLSAKKRFVRQAQALKNHEYAEVERMNDFNLERIAKAEETLEEFTKEKGVDGRYVNKAFYNTVGVPADGGYLIPDPEFLIDVERYEQQYGVAFANASVRTTDRLAIKANTGLTNVELYEVGEAVEKTVTKPTYGQPTVPLREFAGIAVASDKLSDFEAAGFWRDVAEGFGRARAKKADELVFTENGTYKGLIYDTNTTKNNIADIDDIAWSDLDVAETLTLDQTISHTLHKSVLARIRNNGFSDSEIAASILAPRNQTPWGTPVNLAEILPKISDGIAATQGAVVTGDLSKVQLWTHGGLALKMFDTGIVESGEESINLLQQDAIALRAVTWMTKLVTFPQRFVITKEGS